MLNVNSKKRKRPQVKKEVEKRKVKLNLDQFTAIDPDEEGWNSPGLVSPQQRKRFQGNDTTGATTKNTSFVTVRKKQQ
jgi:hypothetical protein